jgi:hypothetical protein
MQLNTCTPRFPMASLALAVMLAAASASASAAPTLQDLINSNGAAAGQIVLGDKTFSNFRYEISGHFEGYTDAMNMAGDIFVHSEMVAGNYGLDFVGHWDVTPGSSATAQLTYNVTVAPTANYYLSDYHLDTDATVTGSGTAGQSVDGKATVRVSISDPMHVLTPMTVLGSNPLVAERHVDTAAGINSSVLNASAYTALGLQPKTATVETLVTFNSANATTNVGLSHIQEGFSQSPVPEPSTWAMTLVGLLVVGKLVRRTARS